MDIWKEEWVSKFELVDNEIMNKYYEGDRNEDQDHQKRSGFTNYNNLNKSDISLRNYIRAK